VKWIFILAVFACCAISAAAQPPAPAPCPAGFVCLPQASANDIFDKLNQLVAAKDLIIKLQTQAGTADTALANALKVIEGHIELHAVNDQIILKKDQIILLYERVMALQMQIIENLEKRLTRGKTTLEKIAGVLKTIGYILAGAALGRGL
jgi:hypothetical protein